jgi:hypothetical protein
MPPPAARMRLCGTRYASADEAKRSKAMRVPGARVEECPDKACGKFHVRHSRPGPPPPRRRAVRQQPSLPPAEFTARVKLLVRTRAGQGYAGDAVCEACGRYLGNGAGDHGQIQHRHARKSGGSRDPVTNGVANAALLCGSSLDPRSCHGKCEARDPFMQERGWWIETGAGPEFDPRYVAVVLHSGAARWLGADGRYLDTMPGTAAA